jgi:putative ABC transport system permease protein
VLREILAVCLAALATHKLRTLLSALGVFFGVGAVIGMLSIGEGAKREALNLIRLMGEKHLIVKVKPAEPASPDRETKAVPRLTERDLAALRAVLPGVRKASPLKALRGAEVTAERTRAQADVFAVAADYAALLNLRILRGRFFSPEDAREARPVCVLGNRLAMDLFAGRDPLGGLVKIRRTWYRVVGTTGKGFEAKGELKGLQVEEAERTVYLPLPAYRLREGIARGESPLDEIALSFDGLDHLPAKKALAERVLRRLHGDRDDAEVVVPLLLLKQRQETQRIFNIVMGCIAGISLLVGGIGIMNIMLASVLERVREIGIRRAVGARRREILLQFLIEASLISGSGGVLGILLGVGIAYAVGWLADWTTAVPLWSIGVSTGVSLAVGVGFGYFPASRAAALKPIEALRWE